MTPGEVRLHFDRLRLIRLTLILDTVGSVAFSPTRAEVVVVSGSRQFTDEEGEDGETETLAGAIALWSIIDRSVIPKTSGEVAND